MSGEPKTHTPQEALRLLRERGMELTFDSNDATPWAVYRDNGEYLNEYLHFGQTQEEVLSAALGVRVVARDEANELRAALEQIAEGAPLTMPTSLVARKHWELATIAREALRRLAGGENER